VRIIAAVMLIAVRPLHAQQVVSPQNEAVTSINTMLKTRPFAEVEDSIVRLTITKIIDRVSWKSQDVYLLGTEILRKKQGFFLGHFLRGLYMSSTSTDRRGHSKAKEELEAARAHWPLDVYAPMKESPDAYLERQHLTGVGFEQQIYDYLLTYYYLQLHYQLSSEYLELNEARQAFEITSMLEEKNYAYDFYSLTRLAWMYYKYRYFAPGSEFPFLKPSFSQNVYTALQLAAEERQKISEYTAKKHSYLRYWTDENTLTWYNEASYNITSLAYGVVWEMDSSITYYEKMSDWMKLRNNGMYLYLADINYRAAERQFEIIGKIGDQPVTEISQPGAVDPYKNLCIYKGHPEEAYLFLDNFPRKYQEDRGWSMIWLGTVNYWNGHLDESIRNLEIAAEYPEVFGNISLNRTHYDLMVHAQQSMTYAALARQIDFEPNLKQGFFARLWEGFTRFLQNIYYRFMAYLHRHWAIDKYLQIEDRQEYMKVYYTENVLDYYQTWSILTQLDPEWHLQRLNDVRLQDKRSRAQRFYHLLEAGFMLEQGKEDEARNALLLNGRPLSATADTSYEKLMVAMAEDMEIKIGGEQQHLLALYQSYPQTVMLWGHRLPLYVVRGHGTIGDMSKGQKESLEQALTLLQKFDFDFRDEAGTDIPALTIRPVVQKKKFLIQYEVHLRGQQIASGTIAATERIRGKEHTLTAADIAKRLAYGVFRIVPHAES